MSGITHCEICRKPFTDAFDEPEKIDVHPKLDTRHFFHIQCLFENLVKGQKICPIPGCKTPIDNHSIVQVLVKQAEFDIDKGRAPWIHWPSHVANIGKFYLQLYSHFKAFGLDASYSYSTPISTDKSNFLLFDNLRNS